MDDWKEKQIFFNKGLIYSIYAPINKKLQHPLGKLIGAFERLNFSLCKFLLHEAKKPFNSNLLPYHRIWRSNAPPQIQILHYLKTGSFTFNQNFLKNFKVCREPFWWANSSQKWYFPPLNPTYWSGTTCIPSDKKKGVNWTPQVQTSQSTHVNEFKSPTLWQEVCIKFPIPSSENCLKKCLWWEGWRRGWRGRGWKLNWLGELF